MLKIQTKAISIVTDKDHQHLSKEQKAFNTLIKKIDEKRASLAAWQEIIPAYLKKYASDYLPLVETSQDIQIEVVHCLDRASDQKGLTSTERRMIHDLISGMTGGLAAVRNDEELKNIYNKHSGSDFDAEEAASMNGLKSMLEDVIGVDLGDDLDMSSPEEIFKRAQAHMQEQQAQFEAERHEYEEHQAKRKKTAKQIAKESQEQAEEQQTSQSIRELYRKLVSALHPDREPDPQERERKTLLMQRINQVYDKKNLLLLLELQLELEHIDQATINNITAGRLKHYNKILKEQLSELEQEIFVTEDMFKAQFGISPFERLTPSTVMRNLAADIVSIQHAIRDLKNDLLAFKDIKMFKAWLKAMRRRQKRDYLDCPF
ncbi:MAG TPA: J domain-containing protein [Gallionella sp.]|nr:J domain-containing protein [Gallionella sp.]